MHVEEIDVAELRRLGTSAGVLVDVRSPGEFAEGHLAGAVNVPLSELAGIAARYAGEPVVVVCRSGQRSLAAARVLAAAGAAVVSLAGGTQAWQRAGHPVITGSASGRPPVVADRKRQTSGSVIRERER